MSKPGVFELTKMAKDHFFENKGIFAEKMMVILPIAAAVMVITQYSMLYKMPWVQIVTLVPMIFLQGMFSLSWHRLSLPGVEGEYKVNPIWPRGKDWKFMRVFLSITLSPAIPPILFTLFILFRVYNNMPFDPAPYVSWVYAASALLVFIVAHYAFLLPASAAGVDLSLSQARRAAKGVRRRLFGGFLIFLLILVLAFYFYSALIGIVAMALGEGTTFGGWGMVVITTLLSLPIFVAIMAFIALVSTMICRAYEWGMANNTIQ